MVVPPWHRKRPQGVVQDEWGVWCVTAGSGVGHSHGAGLRGMPASREPQALALKCGVGWGMVWAVAWHVAQGVWGGMVHVCAGGVWPQGVVCVVALGCGTGCEDVWHGA